MTHSELRKLNRIFGEEFGWNPHHQPNFRWMRTEELFWFIDHGNGWRRNATGLLTYQRKFERRCWADRIGRSWILAKWTFKTEAEWFAQHGDKIPWAKSGEWNPIENWKPDPNNPDQEPTLEITQAFCKALRYHRQISKGGTDATGFEKELDDDWAAYVKSKKSELESQVHDVMTAFGRIPGTHDGQTEFMSGTKETECQEPQLP